MKYLGTIGETAEKSIYLFDNIFCFVKWVGSEKSKPMLIKEILDECEVIKNEND